MSKKAIVLLSGGLDSTTVLAWAQKQSFKCYALSFNYGQKHSSEIQAASNIAKSFKVPHKIFNIDNDFFNKTSLVNSSIEIPDYNPNNEIPNTYVPARNTIFLSVALGLGEMLEAFNICIGISMVDYSGYPDCRQEYIEAFANMANLATVATVKQQQKFSFHTPLLHLSKAETIKLGYELGVDYKMTISCYKATDTGLACGKCDSCHYRKEGFIQAGLQDATRYA